MNKAPEYTSIGGQAVIEGVMMRSPNAFVVAVKKPDGAIRLRRDQWYGLTKKLDFLRKPFLRGVLVLFETMANGIVALNYSANIAMDEEEKEKALKKGKSLEEYEAEKKEKEKINIGTFISISLSFIFGIGLFVMLPHGLTALLEQSAGAAWGLQSFEFHAIDGLIKAFIFILYVFLIGLLPDIKRVFMYHGAEHMAISTFESGLDLTVENARKFQTFHPRCGTTFIFFLLFISIILFAIIFVFVPVGVNDVVIIKHLKAILFKVALTIPIAGISYELIKFSGKYCNTTWGRLISMPGMLLQRLTTRTPDDSQLEVALASIKAVLLLEKRIKESASAGRVLSLDEVDIEKLVDIEDTNLKLKDFLE